MDAPLICVVGPTAVGKTALAVALCEALGGEIVGADASQVYRGMSVGTGKATAAELRGVPHHLIDVAAPDAPLDAATYARLADAAIADVRGRGKRAVLCGGTGLYLRALFDGLSEAPPVEPAIRDELRARIAKGELAALHRELAALDPESAARIAPTDPQRTERALGVALSSGKTLTAWHAAQAPAVRYQVQWVGLDLPREQLNARIEARVARMFGGGFVPEVRALVDAGYSAELRSLGALGYRYIVAALAGEMTLAQAQAQTVVATRRYAKRQLTWFRRLEGVRWFPAPVDPAEVAAYLRGLPAAEAQP